jgi:hypothetical protein
LESTWTEAWTWSWQDPVALLLATVLVAWRLRAFLRGGAGSGCGSCGSGASEGGGCGAVARFTDRLRATGSSAPR